MPDHVLEQFHRWRGIEDPCGMCSGAGRRLYASTATWQGGIGGAAMTPDVCDECWGSGDAKSPGTNLRRVAIAYDLIREMKTILALATRAAAFVATLESRS